MNYKIHEVEQGSEEWLRARLGLITASSFEKVLTPTGKPSSQIVGLINKAVAEAITGEIEEGFKGAAMIRGNDLEQDAFDFLKFAYGYEFERVGLIEALSESDEKTLGFGCSPDGFNKPLNIGLELKCPLAHTHISYLRDGKVPAQYLPQIQGSMMITGAKKWVFCSYHPLIESLILEVERNEEYIGALSDVVASAAKEVGELVKKYSRV